MQRTRSVRATTERYLERVADELDYTIDPPKWVPDEMIDLWTYAVDLADSKGQAETAEGEPNYKGIISIFKNILRKYTQKAEQEERAA